MLQSLSHTLITKGEWGGRWTNLLGLLMVSSCNIFLELCSKRNGLDYFHFIFIYCTSVCSAVVKPSKTPTSPLCLWKPWGLAWDEWLGSSFWALLLGHVCECMAHIAGYVGCALPVFCPAGAGNCFGWEQHLPVSVWRALSTPWAGGRGRTAWGSGSAWNGATGGSLSAPALGFASVCSFLCPTKCSGFSGPGKQGSKAGAFV